MVRDSVSGDHAAQWSGAYIVVYAMSVASISIISIVAAMAVASISIISIVAAMAVASISIISIVAAMAVASISIISIVAAMAVASISIISIVAAMAVASISIISIVAAMAVADWGSIEVITVYSNSFCPKGTAQLHVGGLYADDSASQLYVFLAPGDSAVVLNGLLVSLASVQSWMLMNKLKLNPDKTEFLLLGNDRQRSKYLSLFLMSFSLSKLKSVDRDVNGGPVARNWLRQWFQTLNFKKNYWYTSSHYHGSINSGLSGCPCDKPAWEGIYQCWKSQSWGDIWSLAVGSDTPPPPTNEPTALSGLLMDATGQQIDTRVLHALQDLGLAQGTQMGVDFPVDLSCQTQR